MKGLCPWLAAVYRHPRYLTSDSIPLSFLFFVFIFLLCEAWLARHGLLFFSFLSCFFELLENRRVWDFACMKGENLSGLGIMAFTGLWMDRCNMARKARSEERMGGNLEGMGFGLLLEGRRVMRRQQ